MKVEYMSQIIGRKEEKALLEAVFQSERPEFVALYGRRRVGKTYLIRNTFAEKEDSIFFYVSGLKSGTRQEQIENFTKEMARAFGFPSSSFGIRKSWQETFELLTELISASPKQKIILFFDEFPWMVTRKSKLLQAVDFFWNRFWSMDGRVKLIICGSASNWILKNIVNNIGGLYNRVTRVIHLEPFDLYDTRQYLEYKKVKLSNQEIVHIYMVLGGIPFYLDQIQPGLSAMQNVELLAFKRGSFLLNEFSNLYATLFGADSVHIALVKVLAQHCYGMDQEELIKRVTGIAKGGTLVARLSELEQSGFIQRFTQFGYERKGVFYKLVDEYTIFYFQWIEPNKKLIERGKEKGYWMRIQNSPAWHSWAGCAFEAVCNKHVPLIRDALLLTMAGASQWRFVPKKGSQDKGAQIDLLFDREDNSITLCEIKYTKEPFTVTKAYAQNIQNKIAVFKKHTKTKKALYFAMISANDLKKNMYSEELIAGVVTLDDLFKEYSW